MESSGRSLPGASRAGDFAGILDQLVTDILRESPETATSLSVSEEQAGGRYIDRLGDYTRTGFERNAQNLGGALRQLKTVDRDLMSPRDAATYDVVKAYLEDSIAVAQFKTGVGAQSPYSVTQLTGSYVTIPDLLASQHPITSRDEVEGYLARLTAYGRVLDEESARISQDAADGVIAPDFCIDGALGQLNQFCDTAPAETVLVSSLRRRIIEVADVSATDKAALAAQAEAIVRDTVLPAYQRQIEALATVRPRATHDAGVWRLPNGQALYTTALRAHTTTTLTPDEIHQMGLGLISQLTTEMDTILRAQGMTQGSVAERVQALGDRQEQTYPNTDAGREQLLTALSAQMMAITARMPEVFGTLARAALEIKRVPEYTQAGSPPAYYQPPALDGSRPGAFYINLRDPAAEWPKFSLPTLTYHEGTPGHHWQIAIQQESGSIPFIRSAIIGFNAFSEGWGLYAEQLADEMGTYAVDPFARIGYLQMAMFRASRLVCDTGLHFKRWTREHAIQSMIAATGNPEKMVASEIERYCVWPGQACSYMVGRQALNRMREEARRSLGEKFDIKGFHDTVLTNGSMPLSLTEELVEQWVKSVLGSA